jgi:hypothetical protein
MTVTMREANQIYGERVCVCVFVWVREREKERKRERERERKKERKRERERLYLSDAEEVVENGEREERRESSKDDDLCILEPCILTIVLGLKETIDCLQ